MVVFVQPFRRFAIDFVVVVVFLHSSRHYATTILSLAGEPTLVQLRRGHCTALVAGEFLPEAGRDWIAGCIT
jgi:hypothetical protein